jgi:hypothetical protein
MSLFVTSFFRKPVQKDKKIVYLELNVLDY